MSDADIIICTSELLVEGEKGVRFPVMAGGENTTGFVVRYGGIVRGYLNRCAHVPIELDWAEGDFFDSSGLYLMCATHGAIYLPESGQCAGGPCRGGRLRKIKVLENNGQVFWQSDDYIKPVKT